MIGQIIGRIRENKQILLPGGAVRRPPTLDITPLFRRHRNQNLAGGLATFKITIGLGGVGERIAMSDPQMQPTFLNPAKNFSRSLEQTLTICSVMSKRRARQKKRTLFHQQRGIDWWHASTRLPEQDQHP